MKQHEAFMREAIALAYAAREKGNHPFGALLVLDGRVLLTAENRVNSERDVTLHAELNLVSMAVRRFEAEVMQRAALYTSTEPCAMCAGAIYWAGIPTVVYGCGVELFADLAGGSFVIPCHHIFGFGSRLVTVIGPVLEEEAAAVHVGFWG